MKPSPVATAHECSACGLDWKRHGNKPTLSKCVELLRADLAKAKQPRFYPQGETGIGTVEVTHAQPPWTQPGKITGPVFTKHKDR